MPGAAIYVRISDDRAGDAAGVARQEADCRRLCEDRGWPVQQVYTDNDISAYSGRPRPAWRQMLADIKTGHIDAVAVWHLDRLTRRPIDLEHFFDACDAAGIKHFGTCSGDIDLSTHDGQFLARILGAAARKESDDKSRRTRRKHLELAQAGQVVGSGRPFGYEPDRITIRAAEAVLVGEAVERVLAGETLRSICVDWNRRAIPAVRAPEWTQTALRRILRSARIAGLRSHTGEIVGPAVWPAIIARAMSLLWRDTYEGKTG